MSVTQGALQFKVTLNILVMTDIQTWGDYSTNVIDYDYLPPARLRLRINKITM